MDISIIPICRLIQNSHRSFMHSYQSFMHCLHLLLLDCLLQLPCLDIKIHSCIQFKWVFLQPTIPHPLYKIHALHYHLMTCINIQKCYLVLGSRLLLPFIINHLQNGFCFFNFLQFPPSFNCHYTSSSLLLVLPASEESSCRLKKVQGRMSCLVKRLQ